MPPDDPLATTVRPDPARTFADVTYAEAIARARALVPVLRERAGQTEAGRRLLPANEADLHQAGLFRFGQPRRWGGMELDFVSMFEIPMEVGRGCASTAWNVGNLAVHHWMLALFEPQVQQEVWADNPDALIASGIAYPQGRAERVPGGIRLTGHWNFSSGVDSSQWNMLAAQVRDGDRVVDWLMCLVPCAEHEIIDDWQVMGMRGTGSKSVRVKDLFVPAHRVVSMLTARGGSDFPGAAVNANPMYRIPMSAMAAHCIGGVAVGNAEAALELTIAAVRERSTNYTANRMRDFQAVQLRVAAAASRIEAARLMGLQDCREAQAIAESGRIPGPDEKLRFKRNLAWLVGQCTEAVDGLHAMAGANGIYDGYPIQRLFRDAHALAGHISFSWDTQGSNWGLVALGGSVDNPAL
jgi:3-hydroxy-9,10-secoandrosta-1,3,5(10)-triene-9,17-dione monooxygenase